MKINFDSLMPVYMQIAEAVEDEIISGSLKEGDAAYSQLILARELGVNPATAAKGVRKTWLEGYSATKEFYSPNYSDLPVRPDPDYRRTLYWNPAVTTDEAGQAKIRFYNNSTCRSFNISAETITPAVMIGVYNSQ